MAQSSKQFRTRQECDNKIVLSSGNLMRRVFANRAPSFTGSQVQPHIKHPPGRKERQKQEKFLMVLIKLCLNWCPAWLELFERWIQRLTDHLMNRFERRKWEMAIRRRTWCCVANGQLKLKEPTSLYTWTWKCTLVSRNGDTWPIMSIVIIVGSWADSDGHRLKIIEEKDRFLLKQLRRAFIS